MKDSSLLLIGLTGGIPFVYSAEKAAGGLYVLGWFFGASVLVTGGSNGGWTFWALSKKLNQLMEPFTPSTKKVYKGQLVSQTLKHPVVTVMAIVSTIPYVYKTYIYNDIKLFALLDFFISYGYKGLGYYELWDKTNSLLAVGRDRRDRQLSFLKNELQRKIRRSVVPYLINLPSDQAEREINSFFNGDRVEANRLVEKILAINMGATYLSPRSWLKGRPRQLFVSSSIVIPVSFSVVNALFSYLGAKKVWDNVPFAVSATVVATIPNFIVDLIVTSRTFENFYDYSFNKCRGVITSPYEIFYPNSLVKYGTAAAAFAISLLASSNNVYSTYNFLTEAVGFSETPSIALTAFYTIANLIFSTYTLTKLAGIAASKYAITFSHNAVKKSYAKILSCLGEVDGFLDRINPRVFGEFIYEMGDSKITDPLLELLPPESVEDPLSQPLIHGENIFSENHEAFFAHMPAPSAAINENKSHRDHSWCVVM